MCRSAAWCNRMGTGSASPLSSVQILRLANPSSRQVLILKRNGSKFRINIFRQEESCSAHVQQSSLSSATGRSNFSTTWRYKKAARRRKTWSLGQGRVQPVPFSQRGDVTLPNSRGKLRCHCLPSKARRATGGGLQSFVKVEEECHSLHSPCMLPIGCHSFRL